MTIDFSATMAHFLGSSRVIPSLVTSALFPFFPRTVITHGCSEGPGNRATPVLSPAGPNAASRQKVRDALEADEASARRRAGWVPRKDSCPCILEIQAMLYLPGPVSCFFCCFLTCTDSLSICQALCLLNSIHQRGCLLQICRNQLCVLAWACRCWGPGILGTTGLMAIPPLPSHSDVFSDSGIPV